jgi:hypothetical protein
MPNRNDIHTERPRARSASALYRLTATATALFALLALAGCGSASALLSNVPTSSAPAAAANAITVSPLPGTPDASPSTQISFLGGAGTTVTAVKVRGSQSGTHSGRLAAYSTTTGESFIPTHAFTPGETVNVSARVSSLPGSPTVHTSFIVAHQAPISQAQFPRHPGNPAAVQHFLSAPILTPSTVTITTAAKPGATPGDLFLAPYQGAGTPGPMITDQSGQLIWFHPIPADETATNFNIEQYEGKPVLVWWQGRVLGLGFGQGEEEVYSTSYEPLTTIKAANGYHADLHVLYITPQGTAFIDAFDPVQLNLSSIGGYDQAVVNDGVIEEVDIKTGLVMWEWHALGHIPLKDSHGLMPRHTTNNWDYVHLNSVAPNPANPNLLLISSRNTWAVYGVNMHSGGILWQLGGNRSNFKRGPGSDFFWQHDARWEPGGDISVFDNGDDPREEKQSRGLLLHPNFQTHTVTLVKAFINPTHTLLASSQGDLLNLGDGNWLMGYGGLPNFTEYDSSGNVLLDGTLGPDVQDFRTFLSPWSATPTTSPQIAAQGDGSGGMNVEASWNGATSVASWRVLAGPSPSSLAVVATAPKSGFETTIAVKPATAYVEVVALDPSGATLSSSAAIAPSS